MGDYICKYCQDRTCEICGIWCYEKKELVYAGAPAPYGCHHDECREKREANEPRRHKGLRV